MNKSISLLLGAGFSAPMGYPVGNDLNSNLLALDGTEFGFNPAGRLCINDKTGRPDWGYKTNYDKVFDFCLTLIKHFKEQKGNFNYEEFYDYVKNEAKDDQQAKKQAEEFTRSYSFDNKTHQWIKREGPYDLEYKQLLSDVPYVYNQIVLHFLKDGEGNQWYKDDWSDPKKLASGIERCLGEFSEGSIVNVHTLNQDLLFEALFRGKVSDGFEEQYSPYYGQLHDSNVRLERYIGSYSKPLRLFKLHGSIDYHYYSSTNENSSVFYPKEYVKIKRKVDMNTLKRKVLHDDGTSSYENAPPSYYHPDFLTGTTAKILRYDEPLLYKRLFDCFKENLQQAEKLIIIGYGGGDEKINEVIITHFDYHNKPIYIIDPKANDTLQKLKGTSALDAKLISKELKEITIEDFASSEQI